MLEELWNIKTRLISTIGFSKRVLERLLKQDKGNKIKLKVEWRNEKDKLKCMLG